MPRPVLPFVTQELAPQRAREPYSGLAMAWL